MRRRAAAAAAVIGLLVSVAGCDRATTAAPHREILVFAAASLTDPFTRIGEAFERANASTVVRFNFGPSDGLATGIVNGAPADVFASASPKWMDEVAAGPGVVDRIDFARNRLTVIVPTENPARIETFADIAGPSVKLVLAAPGVPAGTYARQAIANAGLGDALRNLVSNEEDVKGVVQKVVLGEADAGIVYVTDLSGTVAGSVTAVPIPDDVNVLASYPIGAIRGGRQVAAARAFVAFVLDEGQGILRDQGFLAP